MLRQTSVLHDIVVGLDTPEQKYPSLVVLTGNSDNRTLWCDVIPKVRKPTEMKTNGGLQLQIDPSTAFSDYPTENLRGEILEHMKSIADFHAQPVQGQIDH